jgi:hypothetical protein
MVGEEALWKSEERTFLACASGFYAAALPVADHDHDHDHDYMVPDMVPGKVTASGLCAATLYRHSRGWPKGSADADRKAW